MKNEFNFDEAMSRLILIADALEKDDIALDKAILLFEEGLDLSKKCQDQLGVYEEKVKTLVQKHSGQSND